jgi:hypothetical protein
MLSPVESRPGQAVPGRFADHLATGRGKVTAENRKIVGLPPEIHRFFTNPGGHSMIVKGRAGTGKTTLVLQMLEEVFTGLDNFYLSSRVSDTALYKQFPWLLSKERNERLIHASKKFLDSLDRSREDGEVPLAAEDADMDALLMTAPPETDEVKSAKALLKEFRLLNGSFPVAVDRTELSRVEGMFEPPEIETMSDEGDGFTQFHNLVLSVSTLGWSPSFPNRSAWPSTASRPWLRSTAYRRVELSTCSIRTWSRTPTPTWSSSWRSSRTWSLTTTSMA